MDKKLILLSGCLLLPELATALEVLSPLSDDSIFPFESQNLQKMPKTFVPNKILPDSKIEKKTSSVPSSPVEGIGVTIPQQPSTAPISPVKMEKVEKIIPNSIDSEEYMKFNWNVIKNSVDELFQKEVDAGQIDDDDWADIRSISAIIDILVNELQEDPTTSLATIEGYLDFMNFKSLVIKKGLLMAIAPLKSAEKDTYERITERLRAQ